MRYAAVALLLVALNTSAVLAQAPQRESPSSSQPEEQEQFGEMPVKIQPGSPLRFSLKAYRLEVPGLLRLKAFVENVSDREIGRYSIRASYEGANTPERRVGGGGLPGFRHPGKVLRPGQVEEKWEPSPPVSARVFPLLTADVHYVVFTDGSIWCADVCRVAEYTAGRLASERAFADRLQKVLSDGGLDAVIKALREKVAEDDPVPAVVVSTGELVDIVPPRGHTPDWEEGFRTGTKGVADFLWQEYTLNGTRNIERKIRDGFRMVGAK